MKHTCLFCYLNLVNQYCKLEYNILNISRKVCLFCCINVNVKKHLKNVLTLSIIKLKKGKMKNEKTIEKYFCDICGKEAKDVKHLNYPVIFQTEQTEGRSVEPYIDNTDIDVCPNCCKKKYLNYRQQEHKDITVVQ